MAILTRTWIYLGLRLLSLHYHLHCSFDIIHAAFLSKYYHLSTFSPCSELVLSAVSRHNRFPTDHLTAAAESETGPLQGTEDSRTECLQQLSCVHLVFTTVGAFSETEPAGTMGV